MIAFQEIAPEEPPSSASILAERKEWAYAWRKPDRRPIYEWAEENISLPQTYAVPGPFRASPWMRDIFSAIQSSTVREVWLMAAIQSGKTVISDVSIPWVLVNHPGPVMLTMQSEADMKEHMKTRLWPVFRSCRVLMDIMPSDRHDRATQEIYFGSHFFLANGANINALQSKSIQWKFNDELWLPQWQPLYMHAKGRVTAFAAVGASKIINVSQAGNVNDVMDKGYKSGTCRIWQLEDGSPLIFSGKRADGSRYGLTWADDAKRTDGSWNKARAVETCRYVTEAGNDYADEPRTRKLWMESGRWSDPVDGSTLTVESYQLNALLTQPMAPLVAEWCDAHEAARRGDMGPMADFCRKRRAEPWEDRTDSVTVQSRRSGYKLADVFNGEPVTGELHRVATIDRQKGMRGDIPHFWLTARAWRGDGSSRLLYAGRVDTVEGIETIRERLHIPPRLVVQDAGHDPHAVYGDCVRFGWSCMFGSDRKGWEHILRGGRKIIRPYSPLKPVQHGTHRVHTMEFCTDYHKDILSNLVQGNGAAWELPEDLPAEYTEQMEAESKVEVSPGKWKWKPPYSTKPNHLWDCEVMQVVMAVILGLLAAPSHENLDTV